MELRLQDRLPVGVCEHEFCRRELILQEEEWRMRPSPSLLLSRADEALVLKFLWNVGSWKRVVGPLRLAW